MDRVHPNHDKSRREPTITRRSRFIMQRLACNTCAWVRSSTNRERESCRRHPYQMLSLQKDDTHTPSSLCCASLSCQADHRPPLNCLTIQRTNWNASRFPVAPTVVNIFIRSSSNHRHQYFVQKLTTLRGAGVPPLGPECQFAKGNWFRLMCVYSTTRAELHMKPDTNNSARKLYIFRTISNAALPQNSTHLSSGERNWIFC